MNIIKAIWSAVWYLLIWLASMVGVCLVFVVLSLIGVAANNGLGADMVTDEVKNIIMGQANDLLLLTMAWIVTFFIMYHKKHKEWKQEKFWRRGNATVGSIMLCAVVGAAMSLFFMSAFSMSGTIRNSYEFGRVLTGFTQGNILLLIICRVLINSFAEEVMFRGVILKELSKKTKITTAIIMQAILFAVFHMNFLQGFYTFIGGTIIGMLFIRLDSLWAAIATHCAFNLALVIFFKCAIASIPILMAIMIISLLVMVVSLITIYRLKRGLSA